jgi:hypothetical protein
MGPRASMNTLEKGECSVPTMNQTTIVQPYTVTILTELSISLNMRPITV